MLALSRIAGLLLPAFGVGALAPLAVADTPEESVFAEVNGEVILLSTYNAALRNAARARFYHARPPEAELVAFRREVGEDIVDQRLLHQEAIRRGIGPDSGRVEAELGRLVQRYASTPGWTRDQDRILPLLRKGLEERDRIRQLEERLRDVPGPTEAQLSAYYRDHPKTFTSPPRTRVSIILLKVDPSSESEVWEERLAEARRIHAQLLQGTHFADAARRYSDDDSAGNGGDMGYLHEGMLGAQADQVIGGLAPGEIAEPAVLLEGIAIIRLEERIVAQLNPMSSVRERLRELWLRESRERAVQEATTKLRQRAQVRYSNPRYYEIGPEAVTGSPRFEAQTGVAQS
jgi:hypothetical protein